MAEAAGIVNHRGVSNDEAFEAVIAERPAEIQELARAVRSLVYGIYPGAVEVVWPKQGSGGWGTGPKKFSEQFAYLMAYKGHVTLGFCRGGELSDPEGLLPQKGWDAGVWVAEHAQLEDRITRSGSAAPTPGAHRRVALRRDSAPSALTGARVLRTETLACDHVEEEERRRRPRREAV